MAHKSAALKAIRKTVTRSARNRSRRRVVKEMTNAGLAAIKQKEQTALDKVRAACTAIDKAVQKGTLHPNTGARKKSRLMKQLNALTGAKSK